MAQVAERLTAFLAPSQTLESHPTSVDIEFSEDRMMAYFKYGEKELNYLKECDPLLGVVIGEVGFIERSVEPDVFRSLISSIISQQISTKAAVTVLGRLEDLLSDMTALNLGALDIEAIKGCGMSLRKAGYIKGICDAVLSGDLDLESLKKLSDEEVINELIKLNGIGVWSAEMLMIFAFERPNVLSYGDLIIKKGIMKLHGLGELSKKDFEKYRELYTPYGSIASLYLWHIGNSG